jgi:hypothetical protein
MQQALLKLIRRFSPGLSRTACVLIWNQNKMADLAAIPKKRRL